MDKKRIITAKIDENTSIAPGVFRLVLRGEELWKNVCAGQFVNVYLKDKSRLLPRPISICDESTHGITLVYSVLGNGTSELSYYRQGDTIKVSMPNGKGYDISAIRDMGDKGKNIGDIILVGGGIGTAPLLLLAKQIREIDSRKNLKITAVVGFKDNVFLTDELKKFSDKIYITTDSGKVGFKGNVIECIESENISGHMIFACGPKPMLKALSRYACGGEGQYEKRIPIQVSMEERMGCGYGACVGCVCKVRENGEVKHKKVCSDGPVFWADEVIWDD